MILGVGTDLVEIDRMRKACEKEYFVSRTFTEAERGGSQSVRDRFSYLYAGRY